MLWFWKEKWFKLLHRGSVLLLECFSQECKIFKEFIINLFENYADSDSDLQSIITTSFVGNSKETMSLLY